MFRKIPWCPQEISVNPIQVSMKSAMNIIRTIKIPPWNSEIPLWSRGQSENPMGRPRHQHTYSTLLLHLMPRLAAPRGAGLAATYPGAESQHLHLGQRNGERFFRVIPSMTFQDVYLDICSKNIRTIYLTYIFWHSVWHIFWHPIWHMFWHSIWQSIWHIFWHDIWHIFWHSIWHSIWHSTWHIFWQSIWHSRHSIWHSIWHSTWHSIRHIFWHGIWHIFWHSIWHSIWHSTWHIFWQSIWHSRHSIWHVPDILSDIYSDMVSGIYSDILFGILSDNYFGILSGILLSGILPSGILSGILSGGWGPAVHTDIERWLLRSSGAHWDRELAMRRGGEEEKAEEKRSGRAIFKSNNPHLAGGEQWTMTPVITIFVDGIGICKPFSDDFR